MTEITIFGTKNTQFISHFHIAKHLKTFSEKLKKQTFINKNSANRHTLGVELVKLRRKNVELEGQARAKQKWRKLVFDPDAMKVPEFFEQLNEGAEKHSGIMRRV